MKNLLVICPCFNEEESIGSLIDEINQLNLSLDIIVIDDCSNDNTYEIASAKAKTIRLPFNLGIGGAVQTGYLYALQNNYKYAVQIDGDGQHDPAYIEKLYRLMIDDGLDLVVGSRYISPIGFQSSLVRRFGSKIIGLFLKLFFGYLATDPTSGFRLANRNLIDIFSKNYPVDFPEPISICLALKAGYKVAETQVMMRTRKSGVSSISGFKTLKYMINVLLQIAVLRIVKTKN